jgi:hypothetical protein
LDGTVGFEGVVEDGDGYWRRLALLILLVWIV